MTIPLTNQIEEAERRLDRRARPSRMPDEPGHPLRRASARMIRSGANAGLDLARRLDPEHRST
jgi:hypothetical protein